MISSIAMVKAAFNKKSLFTSKLDLNFKEDNSEMLHVEYSFV
jgi:hypothetical protein